MQLCSHKHDEICFDGRDCPLCCEIADRKKEVSELKSEIGQLESRVNELEEEVNSIREPIIAALDTTHKYLEKGQPNEPKS